MKVPHTPSTSLRFLVLELGQVATVNGYHKFTEFCDLNHTGMLPVDISIYFHIVSKVVTHPFQFSTG